ncbi:hypothetical protein H5410_013438, partial [Solanum commersonii]
FGKAITSSNRKRVTTGTTIPPAPTVPRGQTQRYRAKADTSEGRKWINPTPRPNIFQIVQCECGLKFYANWKPDARSHFVTVCGVEVHLTPSTINQSTAKWIRHGHRGYHQSYPYAHMNREAQVWLKIVIKYCIPGLHFTEARVHRGRRYAFRGLITCLCRRARVLEENVDYMTNGPKNAHGPTLITIERNSKDDIITTRMFGLEMLRHKNGCLTSTEEQLNEIETRTREELCRTVNSILMEKRVNLWLLREL